MSGIRFTIKRHAGVTRFFADGAFLVGLPSNDPSTAALKAMVASHEGVCDALEEILNYDGGADNALEDEYVMERAHDSLATARPPIDVSRTSAEGDG